MPRRTNALRADEYLGICGSAVVRLADLERLGLHRNTVLRRCRPGGPWRRLLPAIVLLHNGTPTRAEWRRAALLHAGPGSVLTGLDALELHGMRRMPAPAGPVHLLVPEGRRRVGAGRVLTERTERLPAPVPGPWPLAPITRAALDFARRTTDRDRVRATIAEVVQRGRCTPAALVTELAAGCGRGSTLPREVLGEISDGVRSVAEANARNLARRSGLPPPIWNPRLIDGAGRFVASPDAWFEDVGLAWEIDSYEYHLAPLDYARTLDRRSAMMAEGIVVMHTLPSKLDRRPTEVLTELRNNYTQAALRPRPAITALPANGARGTFAP